jgi:O-Antigen ligase
MYDKSTMRYYKWIFFTALLPYADRFIPFFPAAILGFNLSGFAWIIILIVSLVRILIHFNSITLPGWVWLPWILYISVQWLWEPSFLGLQSTLQYMVFPIVGMAASTYAYTDETMVKLRQWFGWYVIIVLASMFLALVNFAEFGKGTGSVMTLVVLGAILLSEYWMYNDRKMLVCFGLMALIPVLAITRMGVAMMFAIVILHFGNRNIASRILITAVSCCIGVAVFYSQGFQRKMFYSGQGDLTSLTLNNGDINSSGRTRMWMLAEREMKENPWVGAGSRADLKLLIKYRYKLKELHNDFIAVRYNSGLIGLSCLLFGFILQFCLLYRQKDRIEDAYTAVLYYAALTIFIAWAGFMYSDNALKYSPFFGNLHFCLIGIIHSRLKQNNHVLHHHPLI